MNDGNMRVWRVALTRESSSKLKSAVQTLIVPLVAKFSSREDLESNPYLLSSYRGRVDKIWQSRPERNFARVPYAHRVVNKVIYYDHSHIFDVYYKFNTRTEGRIL